MLRRNGSVLVLVVVLAIENALENEERGTSTSGQNFANARIPTTGLLSLVDTTASLRPVACAVLSAGGSRAFNDRHPALRYENRRGRKDKLVNRVRAFAIKTRRRNPNR